MNFYAIERLKSNERAKDKTADHALLSPDRISHHTFRGIHNPDLANTNSKHGPFLFDSIDDSTISFRLSAKLPNITLV